MRSKNLSVTLRRVPAMSGSFTKPASRFDSRFLGISFFRNSRRSPETRLGRFCETAACRVRGCRLYPGRYRADSAVRSTLAGITADSFPGDL